MGWAWAERGLNMGCLEGHWRFDNYPLMLTGPSE